MKSQNTVCVPEALSQGNKRDVRSEKDLRWHDCFTVSKLPFGLTFKEIQELNHMRKEMVLKGIRDFLSSINE